jgi:hypothetical protein
MLAVLQTPSSPPPPPPPANPVVNGGFEAAGITGWTCSGQCGADHGAGLARSGTGNGWVRNASGWNDLHQTLAVAAGRTYRVTAWVRTSANNNAGYLGLRTAGGQVLGERSFARLDGYTQLTVDVATGSNTSVVLYGGLWANGGDTWMQIDDVSAVAL